MREFGGVQIWDDPPQKPMTPEHLARIKAWFDEMVASGKIEVLTVEGKYGTVTFIRAGSARNDLEEN